MAAWRFGHGWSEQELQRYLAELADCPVNFTALPEAMTREQGWTVDGIQQEIGCEPPGPPGEDGLFARARQGISNYDFSDPRIVVGHFDPAAPLAGRNMLLEMKVLGFRFLNGCRVHSVRQETTAAQALFGYRYDTLQGHIEQGFEWFLLTKDAATGRICFTIEAHWRLGDFPNWWSRLGFRLLGEQYRALWRRRAPERLSRLAHQPARKPLAAPGELAHRGDPSPQPTQDRGGSPG